MEGNKTGLGKKNIGICKGGNWNAWGGKMEYVREKWNMSEKKMECAMKKWNRAPKILTPLTKSNKA